MQSGAEQVRVFVDAGEDLVPESPLQDQEGAEGPRQARPETVVDTPWGRPAAAAAEHLFVISGRQLAAEARGSAGARQGRQAVSVWYFIVVRHGRAGGGSGRGGVTRQIDLVVTRLHVQ